MTHTSISEAATAIHDLINRNPYSPHRHEIEAVLFRLQGPAPVHTPSDLARRIRQAIDRTAQAEFAASEGEARPHLDAVVRQCWAELEALEAQIPSPPRSPADLLMRAEIAFFWTDKGPDGDLLPFASMDGFEQASVQLIEAVMQYAAGRTTTEGRAVR
jgi:hypothetical protein